MSNRNERIASARPLRSAVLQHHCARLAGITLLAAVLAAPTSTVADTIGYWRHEEGVSGSIVPDGDNTVLDSSGLGNHMRTFSSANAPFTAATYSPLVSPLSLRSGEANNLSLDFGPSPAIGMEDGGGKNDDNYTEGKPIQTYLFTAMTVELAFNMNAVDSSFQTLFGKDGKPLGDDPGEPDSPVAPLQIKVRGDSFPDDVPNQLFVEWIDGDGDIHFLSTGETVTPGEWLHVAFTLTATDAELWVAGETGDYVLKDAISNEDFAGSLGPGEVTIFEPLGYSIGRGFFGNGVTDWADALIDEVRVSDTALTPNEFLFETVPDAGLAGDYNNDDVVNLADYTLWRDNLGAPAGTLPNDPSGTAIGLDQYQTWKDSFGQSGAALGGVASAAVPEPAAGLLLTSLGALLAASRQGFRRS